MAILTLEQIELAIQEVLINQSYTLNGRQYNRANLENLRELRKELRDELKDGDIEKALPKGVYRASFKH